MTAKRSLVKAFAIKAMAASALSLTLASASAEGPKPNDNLNATLWTQQSIEFKGNAIGAYALARMRLDEALADKNWTASPEQTGDYQNKAPAIILDVDETVLDNSLYQAWMVLNDKNFSSKTWGPFVNSVSSLPIPGSLEFINYAVSKGVKVFYVSNRTGDLEDATRENLKKYGYPIDESEDTVLLKKEKPEWKSSKKGVRREAVGANHRILLLLGDNLGDFTDKYKGTQAEIDTFYKENADKFGKEWIVITNPTYGSWESRAYGFNYGLSTEEKRQMKEDALVSWDGK
ncbi:5'-nucleotidase, lipoprotein e(P4) family [Rhodovibrionaceae bacterium A322]